MAETETTNAPQAQVVATPQPEIISENIIKPVILNPIKPVILATQDPITTPQATPQTSLQTPQSPQTPQTPLISNTPPVFTPASQMFTPNQQVPQISQIPQNIPQMHHQAHQQAHPGHHHSHHHQQHHHHHQSHHQHPGAHQSHHQHPGAHQSGHHHHHGGHHQAYPQAVAAAALNHSLHHMPQPTYILPGSQQAAQALYAHPIPVNNRKITDQTGCDVEAFLVNTLRQNSRDRLTIYTLEKDMLGFCSNPSISGIRFPKMTSYHRMLVHRIATYFGLDHNVDDTGRQVVCHKGQNTRIPAMRLEELVKQAEQKEMIYGPGANQQVPELSGPNSPRNYNARFGVQNRGVPGPRPGITEIANQQNGQASGVQISNIQSAANSGQNTGLNSGQNTSQNTVQNAVQNTVQSTLQNSAKNPVQNSIQNPVQISTQNPVQTQTPVATQNQTQNPVQNQLNTSTNSTGLEKDGQATTSATNSPNPNVQGAVQSAQITPRYPRVPRYSGHNTRGGHRGSTDRRSANSTPRPRNPSDYHHTGGYNKDYSKDYNKDYSKDYNKDFSKDLVADYNKDTRGYQPRDHHHSSQHQSQRGGDLQGGFNNRRRSAHQTIHAGYQHPSVKNPNHPSNHHNHGYPQNPHPHAQQHAAHLPQVSPAPYISAHQHYPSQQGALLNPYYDQQVSNSGVSTPSTASAHAALVQQGLIQTASVNNLQGVVQSVQNVQNIQNLQLGAQNNLENLQSLESIQALHAAQNLQAAQQHQLQAQSLVQGQQQQQQHMVFNPQTGAAVIPNNTILMNNGQVVTTEQFLAQQQAELNGNVKINENGVETGGVSEENSENKKSLSYAGAAKESVISKDSTGKEIESPHSSNSTELDENSSKPEADQHLQQQMMNQNSAVLQQQMQQQALQQQALQHQVLQQQGVQQVPQNLSQNMTQNMTQGMGTQNQQIQQNQALQHQQNQIAIAQALAQQNAQLQAEILAQQGFIPNTSAGQVMYSNDMMVSQSMPAMHNQQLHNQQLHNQQMHGQQIHGQQMHNQHHGQQLQHHQIHPQFVTLNPHQLNYPQQHHVQEIGHASPMGHHLAQQQVQPPAELQYFQVGFKLDNGIDASGEMSNENPLSLRRVDAEIVLNFLRQQWGGNIYWQPKTSKTDVNDKKIDVSNFNIYCSLHPSLAIQAQNDIASKNCNFGLTQVEAGTVLGEIHGVKGAIEESKDSAIVEEDKTQILASSMAAIKI